MSVAPTLGIRRPEPFASKKRTAVDPTKRPCQKGSRSLSSILQQPYEVKAGELHIPDAPGVGLDWDEKAVAALG